jgi:thiamine-monophosphate kinase
LGLKLIRALPHSPAAAQRQRKKLSRLLQPHLYPRIRIKLGAWLARNGVASALMDLSDGLSSDLPRLCRASGVGARVWLDRIPRADAAANSYTRRGIRIEKFDPLAMALHGGDDYELLFTVPRPKLAQLRYAPGFSELHEIGQITPKGEKVVLVDSNGKEKPLLAMGWDSFRGK